MRILNVEWKWNIPNVLSLFRIVLVPVFLVLYLTPTVADEWAFLTLLVSGLTDIFDGLIARKFNQITDCGKLLDPLSDKVTQVAVVVALTTRYTELLPLTILCFLKELCQGIGGVILLKKGAAVRGSKWFGKVSTVLFYVCMLILVLCPEGYRTLRWVLVGVAGISMLMAFLGYLQIFLTISRGDSLDAPTQATEKG